MKRKLNLIRKKQKSIWICARISEEIHFDALAHGESDWNHFCEIMIEECIFIIIKNKSSFVTKL